MNFDGLFLGLCAFAVIGVFHPIVIKSEYHFGAGIWPAFLALGLGFSGASLFLSSSILRCLVALVGFSCLWSIIELFEQRERVAKGWFPKKPPRGGKAD